jgi:uncharacterized protein (TIGR03083 family)
VDTADVFRRTAANRRRAADLLAGLTAEQWGTPSLCAGWTVRVLAGHLLMPVELPFGRLAVAVVRSRGSLDRAVDTASRRLARRPPAELVAALRAGADARVAPPFLGAAGPVTHASDHLRDAARPLGSAVSPPPDDWGFVLDFLTSPPARHGFVPRGRLTGLALRAGDLGRRWGDGAELAGPAEALAMAAAGRAAALADLTGDGVAILQARLAA